MKKIVFLAALAATIVTTETAMAQVHVGVSVNIGRPPVVYNQPVYYNDNLGWSGMEDYYYLPDVGCYYNVGRRMYFYPNGNRWMMASCLPQQYNGYSWNMGRRIRYNGRPDFVYGRGGGRGNVVVQNNYYRGGNRGYGNNGGGRGYNGGGGYAYNGGGNHGGYDNRGGGYDHGNHGGGDRGGFNNQGGGDHGNHGGGGRGR